MRYLPGSKAVEEVPEGFPGRVGVRKEQKWEAVKAPPPEWFFSLYWDHASGQTGRIL